MHTPVSHKLIRATYLGFPLQSLHEKTFQKIAQEGFDRVGLLVKGDKSSLPNQAFNFKEAHEACLLAQNYGLGVILLTGYMKYNEALLAKDPDRRMIVAGPGGVLDSDRLKARWLSPFIEKNKQYYKEFLKEIVKLPGLVEISLNDEATLGFGSGAIGCYARETQETFFACTGHYPPKSPKWDDPTWFQWIQWRLKAWIELHEEFRDFVKSLNPDVEVGIQESPLTSVPYLLNGWISGVSFSDDSQSLDTVATDPYHFLHADLFPHRPHRRILTETTRIAVAGAVGKAVNILPQGFMPPGSSPPMGRADGIAAGLIPFALGAGQVSLWTYELMKIIPGYFEGFQEVMEKLLPELRQHRPYSYASMIYPYQSDVWGHGEERNWGSKYLSLIPEFMYLTALPWKWRWDQRLADYDDFENIDGPLVVPDAHCLTTDQWKALYRLRDNGNGIIWIGNRCEKPWPGDGFCLPPHKSEYGDFALTPCREHEIFEDCTSPCFLRSRVDWDGPQGQVLATVGDAPGLVIHESENAREAWLRGFPSHLHIDPKGHPACKTLLGNFELFTRLLKWVSGKEPVVRLWPAPPDSAYGRIRPHDRRSVPTAELFPLLGANSILALIIPYAPCRVETNLIIAPPGHRKIKKVCQLWKNMDLTKSLQPFKKDSWKLPIAIGEDTDLLAVKICLEE